MFEDSFNPFMIGNYWVYYDGLSGWMATSDFNINNSVVTPVGYKPISELSISTLQLIHDAANPDLHAGLMLELVNTHARGLGLKLCDTIAPQLSSNAGAASINEMEIIYTKQNTPSLKAATDGSAGYDLCAMIEYPIQINPGKPSVLVPTGIRLNMNIPNICAMILPRSGNGHKHGLVLGNGTGLIDSDYQQEIMVSLCVRPGHEPMTIIPLQRIAQLVFVPVYHPTGFNVVTEFSVNSDRGGFGSTGDTK